MASHGVVYPLAYLVSYFLLSLLSAPCFNHAVIIEKDRKFSLRFLNERTEIIFRSSKFTFTTEHGINNSQIIEYSTRSESNDQSGSQWYMIKRCRRYIRKYFYKEVRIQENQLLRFNIPQLLCYFKFYCWRWLMQILLCKRIYSRSTLSTIHKQIAIENYQTNWRGQLHEYKEFFGRLSSECVKGNA